MKVNSLTHMVVVVDENSGEGATAALEEQLQVRLSCQAINIFYVTMNLTVDCSVTTLLHDISAVSILLLYISL